MRSGWDWLLFFSILALGSLSILIIYSINSELARNQIIYWFLAILTLLMLSNFEFRGLQKIALPLYFASLFFLVVVIFLGESIRGSIRWIEIGAFRFQPSELAKVAAILALARYFNFRTAANIYNLISSFLLIVPLFFLVFIEPDIGNALTFLAIWAGISLVSNINPRHILGMVLGGVLLFFLVWQLLAPYQKSRIESFLNPGSDPLGTGYNVIQSKIAVGSGQLLGRGFSQGSQSQLAFLPEAESDFIFASIAEQLGLLGASLIIILYFLLFFRLISIAQNASRFGQLLISGVISFLMVQFLVNIGMNLGLLPITGITLPLVSYGGSSLVSTCILLGIVFSVKRYSKY